MRAPVCYHREFMKPHGRLCALVATCLLSAAPLSAHPVPFSYLDLRLEPSTVDATLVMHIFDLGHDLGIAPAERLLEPAVAGAQSGAIAALVAGRVSIAVDGRPVALTWTDIEVLTDRQSLRIHARFALDAPAATVTVEGTLFPYDPQHQTFINVYEGDRLTQAMLDRGRARFEYFAGSRQGVAAVVARFVPAGVHHILIGPDHILFLVGLLLLGGSMRRLAFIVTGFTAAHSLTLSLSALDVVSLPARLIEPAIALSIVYVGADNLLVRQGRDVRAWIAVGFGFIHGFGFANVLREMDLPARALGWSLFSFNAGVEIGQLLVVAVVAAALGAMRSRATEAFGRRFVRVGSIVVMVVGAFWFVQRVVFPGGS